MATIAASDEGNARARHPARRCRVPELCRSRRDRYRGAADEIASSACPEEAYGVAFSAFFWIYAPVQLFAGWLCDRFSVYKLMAGGILLWAASTLLMGFAGGLSRCWSSGSCSESAKAFPFPEARRSSPAMSRPNGGASPMPPLLPGIALGPAVGTLAGGLILGSWGWRAIFLVFGLVDAALAASLAADHAVAADDRPSRRRRQRPDRRAADRNGRCGRCRSSTRSAIIASISCSPGCRCS